MWSMHGLHRGLGPACWSAMLLAATGGGPSLAAQEPVRPDSAEASLELERRRLERYRIVAVVELNGVGAGTGNTLLLDRSTSVNPTVSGGASFSGGAP